MEEKETKAVVVDAEYTETEHKAETNDKKKNGGNVRKAFADFGHTLKKTGEAIAAKTAQIKKENDIKRLSPVFLGDYKSPDFSVPSIINIIDFNKRKENEACKDAIGFITKRRNVRVLHVYSDSAKDLGLRFYPQQKNSIYYVNPCYGDLYIDVDEYFTYMKQVRVDELESVAYSLGAKHIKIELRVMGKETSRYTSKNRSGVNSKKSGTDSSLTHSGETNTLSTVSVAAETDFEGNDSPAVPNLVYFKDDSNINLLISMRMKEHGKNGIKSKTYVIQYGNTTGVTKSEAADVQFAIRSIRGGTGNTFETNVIKESDTLLEYTINF